MTLAPTYESRDILKKYEYMEQNERSLLGKKSNNSDGYSENLYENQIWLRWRFTSKTTRKLNETIIVVRPVFNGDKKYYSQVFLDDFLSKLAG